MKCALCRGEMSFEEGERVVCPECGADFGHKLSHSFDIHLGHEHVDITSLEAAAKLDSALRLLEFVG